MRLYTSNAESPIEATLRQKPSIERRTLPRSARRSRYHHPRSLCSRTKQAESKSSSRQSIPEGLKAVLNRPGYGLPGKFGFALLRIHFGAEYGGLSAKPICRDTLLYVVLCTHPRRVERVERSNGSMEEQRQHGGREEGDNAQRLAVMAGMAECHGVTSSPLPISTKANKGWSAHPAGQLHHTQ